MERREQKIKYISGALLLLFVLYYSNITFFNHVHIINGVTISHSHLHTKGHHSTPLGNHSKSELTLIAHCSDLKSLVAIPQHINFIPLLTLQREYAVAAVQRPYSENFRYVSLRGPPIV